MKLGNNPTTDYAYFTNNFRLQNIQVGSLLNLTYKYDNIGNVMSITDTATFGATPQYQRFIYDDLDRLTSAQAISGTTGNYTGAYVFNQIGNIISTTMLGTYGYNSSGANSVRPHAVITTTNKNSYAYDGNGNMTQRVEWITNTQYITYTQGWDSENRLKVVTATNGITTSITQFIYDGDGNRVLQLLPDGSKTAYASAIEVSITGTQRITKTYYSAGSTLVAMRVISSPTQSTLYFMSSDHLGSSSLTTDISGTLVARQLYDAWGNVRSGGGMPTDVSFTGQRRDSATNLVFMHARYYDSALGRFISSDSVVPNAAYPQAFNRYSYAINSPLNYRDPSGHVYDDWKDCSGSAGKADCWKYNQEKNILEGAGVTGDVLSESSQNTAALLEALTKGFGVTFSWGWGPLGPARFNWTEASAMTQGIVQIARVFGVSIGNVYNGASVFKSVFSGVDIMRGSGDLSVWGHPAEAGSDSNIVMWGNGARDPNALIHEFGHIFDFRINGYHNTGDRMLAPYGFPSDLLNSQDGWSKEYHFGPFYSGNADGVERFADMFLGYTVGGFDLDHNADGQLRNLFMQTFMGAWLNVLYH